MLESGQGVCVQEGIVKSMQLCMLASLLSTYLLDCKQLL